MRKRGLGFVGATLVLFAASEASAHRLDEYVEQTLIELAEDRVVLHVGLTPGVAVAPEVIATLDRNYDGSLDASEQASYTEQVRRALTLSLDDEPTPLRAVDMRYPAIEDMANGVATIALKFESARAVDLRSGTLRFANHHAREHAVYLVNSLLPRDPTLQVSSQLRSPNQSSYQAQLSSKASGEQPSGSKTALYAAMFLTAGAFVWRALRRTPVLGQRRL